MPGGLLVVDPALRPESQRLVDQVRDQGHAARLVTPGVLVDEPCTLDDQGLQLWNLRAAAIVWLARNPEPLACAIHPDDASFASAELYALWLGAKVPGVLWIGPPDAETWYRGDSVHRTRLRNAGIPMASARVGSAKGKASTGTGAWRLHGGGEQAGPPASVRRALATRVVPSGRTRTIRLQDAQAVRAALPEVRIGALEEDTHGHILDLHTDHFDDLDRIAKVIHDHLIRG